MVLRMVGIQLNALMALMVISSLGISTGITWGQASSELDAALVWQIALESEGFSPGLIDGKPGPKTRAATIEFQRARGLPPSGELDRTTAVELRLAQRQALASYTVQSADRDRITGVTQDWNERAHMKFLGYDSLTDALAERFHCSRALLARLNPGVAIDSLRVGDRVIGPAIESAKAPKAASLEVNLSQKTIRAFDTNRRVVGFFHCSIAADVAKRPSGRTTVRVLAPNPNYTFDPAMWPEVKNVNRKLTIPPGPRNPVGLFWIGLDLPGYGIHGTPWPELIGKTGSHGCIRLTNWDAVRLGSMVHSGMTVVFVTDEQGLVRAR